MTSELTETWTTRDLRVLEVILQLTDKTAGGSVELKAVRAELDLPGPQMLAAVRALVDSSPPYIEVELAAGWSDWRAGGYVLHVCERTRRELGTWPAAENLAAQIADALRAAADNEPDAEKSGRLRAAAETLTGIARDVLDKALAAKLGQVG